MLLQWLAAVLVLAAGVNCQQTPASTAASSAAPSSSSDNAASTPTSAYPIATILFMGNISAGFAGAYIHAEGCSTTYSLSCTNSALCTGAVATVTQGPLGCIANLYTSVPTAQVFFSQSCSLIDINAAKCSEYVSLSRNGTTTTTSGVFTPSGTNLQYLQVPITAGGEALASPVAACTTSISATGSAEANGASKATHGLDTSTRIGVGVGVGVGLALTAGLVGALFWYRRRSRQLKTVSEPPTYSTYEKRETQQSDDIERNELSVSPVSTQELPAHSPVVELPDDQKRAELEAFGESCSKPPAHAISPQELPGDARQLK